MIVFDIFKHENVIEKNVTVTSLKKDLSNFHMNEILVQNENLKIEKIDCSLDFYKYIFCSVGLPYCWYSRLVMDDNELKQILKDENTEIYVLFVDLLPMGFCELSFISNNQIDSSRKFKVIEKSSEIKFFGINKDIIGKGYGRFLMHYIIDMLALRNVKNIFIETCSLDHPKAMGFYQKNGFSPYDRCEKKLNIPSSVWTSRGDHLL